MTRANYEPNIYAGLEPGRVLDRLRQQGWDPVPIRDHAGFIYPPHSHATTKLIALLTGSIEMTIAGRSYHCRPGDQVVIPGGVEHAALVGPDGCTFYWSEQLR